jgi:hypothetical protein
MGTTSDHPELAETPNYIGNSFRQRRLYTDAIDLYDAACGK